HVNIGGRHKGLPSIEEEHQDRAAPTPVKYRCAQALHFPTNFFVGAFPRPSPTAATAVRSMMRAAPRECEIFHTSRQASRKRRNADNPRELCLVVSPFAKSTSRRNFGSSRTRAPCGRCPWRRRRRRGQGSALPRASLAAGRRGRSRGRG